MTGYATLMSEPFADHPGYRPWGDGAAPMAAAPLTDDDDLLRQSAQPSLLLIGEEARRPGEPDLAELARLFGFRLLDSVPVAAADARLAMLVDVDVILVRCTGTEAGLEGALIRLDALSRASGTRVLAYTGSAGLEGVYAALQSDDAIILCDPQREELLAALALCAGAATHRPQLHDIGRENDTTRIEQLNDQLIRLSRTIEALVQDRTGNIGGPDGTNNFGTNSFGIGTDAPAADGADALRSPARAYAAAPAFAAPAPGAAPRPSARGLTAAMVRALLRTRRLRDHIVAADLFADPAWDILLDLMAARLEGKSVSVSSLCIAAAVPPTTALRWIRQLTDRGLLVRHADPQDGRRIFIALSDEGADLVTRWYDSSREHMLAALGR